MNPNINLYYVRHNYCTIMGIFLQSNQFLSYLCGYRKTLRVAPIDLGGKFLKNLAITTPLFPCALQILPQIAYDNLN